jgi:hypothetical protein
MKRGFISFILFVCLILTNSLFAQKDLGEVGKIYKKAEANKLFGEVRSVVKIKVSDLKNTVNKVDKYIMFRIDRDVAIVTDSKRNVKMGPENLRLAPTDVMHLYSKSVLNNLLAKSSDEYVSLEMREKVFSVTYGEYTMEMAVLCPPVCD